MNIRNYISIFALFFASDLHAQFSSGSQFFIGANTTVSIDGLALRPTFNNTWENKTLTVTSTPIVGSPTSSISRVYDFNEPIGFNGTVGISYTPQELNGNEESMLQIAYFNPTEQYKTTSDGTVDQAAHHVSKFFSGFNNSLLRITAVAAGSTLPVKLISFQATRQEQQAFLTWSTSDEINSDYFEVQRSRDGKVWKALGEVKADGDTRTGRTYTFNDETPDPSQNLYRLKMVDQDGTYAYSRIVNVDFSLSDAFVSVYPNPVSDKTTVRAIGQAAIQQVLFTSVAGKSMKAIESKGVEGDTKEFDLTSFPSGIYIMNTILKDGTNNSTKILKK
ncbi:T9SS type A sorting domain-containing protein [Dyadobacter aurulentus]|uniref:T9SS type A sorting domain-containing protein n=1 Tax=Dyadobacter sp. UC 10 TaxID=2605428 RepID=UPI001788A8BB|nr:T9SS type A sorting domain-containing protein [Dyadobacter sp. UC 10]